MSLFLELNNLMVKYQFRPEKRLGQHFIVNEGIIEKIVNAADLKSGDRVLEIGAGTGFLTRKLLEKSKVLAFEKDERLCELLLKELEQENLELHCSDYLTETGLKYDKAVSFPPYFLSKKITMKLLEEKPELCVLVFQREFAEKLQAMPGFEEYSALSVLAQYYYNVEATAHINAKRFFPKPKSDSSLVMMRAIKRRKKAADEQGFACFVDEVFRHKNKNLSNALQDSKEFLSKRASINASVLEKFKDNESGRKVFMLDVEEFVELYNSLRSGEGKKKKEKKPAGKKGTARPRTKGKAR
ncbi:MAG: 16S rRNA (adenine(1518)-N(6)/adenine(1519)-N(6))-dimethyltransferase RsmA [Candidatus Diapherotrites archaeon]|nr:16S rRNA (adenine(1518)-N(6)/adenine(1519)-N(6))-dimethyltransferase RsmA [Candidatus Diapherotrites archaeon]